MMNRLILLTKGEGYMNRFFGAKDMTHGSPAVCLIQFSVPLLIGNLAQQLYSTVDSVVVGIYVGDGALAAVGASFPLINLLLVLFVGISTGAGIMVSQYFGAREQKALSKTVGNTIVLTFFCSLFITAVGLLTCRWFMTLLRTPADIYDMSCVYLDIIFYGMIGSAYYNILSGILRGLGDSLMPLIFLLISCALNIVLDLMFVINFSMGVAGVAWATIISQMVSSVLCLWRLLRMRDVLVIDREALRLDRALCVQLFRLGLPSGASQAIFSMAALMVQSLTNTFGSMVITANIIVMRVDGFAMMPNFSFGMAMTTFAGQNVGAGRMDRVSKGTRDGLKIGLLVSAVLVLLIVFFGKYLMQLFTSTESVLNLGMRMLWILSPGYLAMAVTQILSGTMRGAGDTVTPMWISLITTVIIRTPLAYLMAFLTRSELNPAGNPDVLFLSLSISWVLGAAMTVLFYLRGRWKKKGIAQSQMA